MRMLTLLGDLSRTAGKCLLTVALVAGVGLLMLGGDAPDHDDPGGEIVGEAKADIWTTRFAPQSGHDKFVDMLKEMGMEKPREYRWNGNDVYFTTMTTDRNPRRVLRDVQKRLVRRGLNESVHTSFPNPEAELPAPGKIRNGEGTPAQKKAYSNAAKDALNFFDDMVGGGAVPFRITDREVVMGGISTRNGADTAIEFMMEHGRTLKKNEQGKIARTEENVDKMLQGANLTSMIDSMRYLDVQRLGGGETRLTSTWTKEGVDVKKFLKPQDEATGNLAASTSDPIPTCPGCENLARFASKENMRHVVNIFDAGKMDPSGASSYYERALEQRGWEPVRANAVVRRAAKHGIAPDKFQNATIMSRGSEFVSIHPYRADRFDSTLVEVMQMP